MNITHFGHACVLVEMDGIRTLIDSGAYSTEFEDVVDLDLVLTTHEHRDHVDPERLAALLERNPAAQLVTIAAVAAALPNALAVTIIEPAHTLTFGDLAVEAVGGDHALIHALVPNVGNTGFFLGGRLLHPDDSFDAAPSSVDVLLLPAGGPRMRLQEAIDFERAIAPRVSIPIHEADLAQVHQVLHYQLLENLAPEGTTFVALDHGVPASF
jgi:L-ascorbate metabolism protein UlaG (beta-lactamase superfamily)